MLKIINKFDIDPKKWDVLVKSSSVASWFQTQEAYAFFDSLSFLDSFVMGVENDGQLKGIAVGYIQKDGGKIKQLFSKRAIILGGPLLS
ncbi:MAG: GNAT family N-acetyltransferase, partial [Bacteroidales bacterium]|nr:GNAT family N-acetyltransferase [Bacteroidales bacterium]